MSQKVLSVAITNLQNVITAVSNGLFCRFQFHNKPSLSPRVTDRPAFKIDCICCYLCQCCRLLYPHNLIKINLDFAILEILPPFCRVVYFRLVPFLRLFTVHNRQPPHNEGIIAFFNMDFKTSAICQTVKAMNFYAFIFPGFLPFPFL